MVTLASGLFVSPNDFAAAVNTSLRVPFTAPLYFGGVGVLCQLSWMVPPVDMAFLSPPNAGLRMRSTPVGGIELFILLRAHPAVIVALSLCTIAERVSVLPIVLT